MITKFDSLYAGHTDLDNVGYGGTPINERRYSNAHLATALSKAEAMAKLMDGLGYNCFWMAEHHFQSEGTECIPNTILMALHLAHQTKTIKIGCGLAAAGGGLRHRRHPHRRPHRLWRRSRLPYTRGGNVRFPVA
ncbi:MAG TPA: LLM class flavin-dependent oxidoreductase [Xanthobacteraceae bacterium]